MTMLSAQPITLTGEQHQHFWTIAKQLRNIGCQRSADEIESTLMAAVNAMDFDARQAAPPATASSGEAA